MSDYEGESSSIQIISPKLRKCIRTILNYFEIREWSLLLGFRGGNLNWRRSCTPCCWLGFEQSRSKMGNREDHRSLYSERCRWGSGQRQGWTRRLMLPLIGAVPSHWEGFSPVTSGPKWDFVSTPIWSRGTEPASLEWNAIRASNHATRAYLIIRSRT